MVERTTGRWGAAAALALIAVTSLSAGCSDDGDDSAAGGRSGAAGNAGSSSGGSSSGGSSSGGSGGGFFDASTGDGSGGATQCDPPDMLIALDRTMSMHRKPDGSVPADTAAGHMESKWYIAVTAIESITAKLDTTLRFGLELWPRDPGGTICVTLSERISGTTATNNQCEGGEVAVQPALGSSSAIAAAIDPDTTRLCNTTPIGAALDTARSALTSTKVPGREQYAILIGDGQDTCDKPGALAAAQALAASGAKLFVIGFDATAGTGVNKAALNDYACAGRTAANFPAPCTDDGAGNYRATNPDGDVLYLLADNAQNLDQALSTVAGKVCCNCVP